MIALSPGLQAVLDTLQQVVVALSLVLEGEPAVRDVVQVLQPLKVGDSDTTSVDVHVGDYQAAVLLMEQV